jgi:hypothetical protein
LAEHDVRRKSAPHFSGSCSSLAHISCTRAAKRSPQSIAVTCEPPALALPVALALALDPVDRYVFRLRGLMRNLPK